MKKCSQVRIKRRLAKKKFKKENRTMLKTNKCWDELEMLHATTAGLFFSTKNITPILRNDALVEKMGKVEVARIASVINSDLGHYKNELEKIHQRHAGKMGGSDDPDTLFETVMIGQKYSELVDSFNLVVTPNLDRLLNMAAQAAAEMEDKPIEPVVVTMEEVIEQAPETIAEENTEVVKDE